MDCLVEEKCKSIRASWSLDPTSEPYFRPELCQHDSIVSYPLFGEVILLSHLCRHSSSFQDLILTSKRDSSTRSSGAAECGGYSSSIYVVDIHRFMVCRLSSLALETFAFSPSIARIRCCGARATPTSYLKIKC